MARLLGLSTAEVQRDRIAHARLYARTRGVTLVLKGARTVIACPDGTAYVNTTGHAGMATGGAGDVLTGIIAGLLSRSLRGISLKPYRPKQQGQEEGQDDLYPKSTTQPESSRIMPSPIIQ